MRRAVARHCPRGPADARAADRGPQRDPGGRRGVHRRLHRGFVGHVGAREQPADLASDPLSVVFVQVGDDDRGPRRRQHPGRRLAEPARTTRNNCRSTVQLHDPEHTWIGPAAPGWCAGAGPPRTPGWRTGGASRTGTGRHRTRCDARKLLAPVVLSRYIFKFRRVFAIVAGMRRLRGNPWAVLVVVSLGFFMTLLDLTIVNIAIPNIIDRLHASLDDVLWVLNAYALVLAVLVITAGRLGDLLGPRTMFALGVAVFTIASAACGLAPGAGWLIAFRAVQGLGAAMLMPQTLAIVTMVFPAERRGAAFGVWGAVAGRGHRGGPHPGRPAGDRVRLAVDLLRQPADRGRGAGRDLRHHPGSAAGPPAPVRHRSAWCWPAWACSPSATAWSRGRSYNWGTITSFISIPLILGVGVVLLAVFFVVQQAAPGPRAARPVRPVPQPELHADELGLLHAVGRHAGHLPAVHHLPAVRARFLRAEGRA